jgi:hypothetical protein
MDLTDPTQIFAIVFALIALAVAFGAVAFALWYQSDQTEL